MVVAHRRVAELRRQRVVRPLPGGRRRLPGADARRRPPRRLFANATLPPLGTRPAKSAKPPYKGNFACHTPDAVPNLSNAARSEPAHDAADQEAAPVFVAIVLLFVLAVGVGGYILSNQRFYLPAWFPVLGTDFYEVNAELQTAQAVVPGQGQTVNIAGVKVGDVGNVTLEDGRAVVQMKIQDKYKPIYKDATILLRPKTGLKDMYLALDPGTKAAGEIEEGGSVPVANTLPDVNSDEILAQLDDDTRAYLRVLLNAGGTAFDDEATGGAEPYDQTAAQDLREAFKRFEPTARDGNKLTRLLARRRGTSGGSSTTSRSSRRRSPTRPPARRAGRLGQRQLRGLRVRGDRPARGAAALPGRARPDRDHAREDGRAGR